MTQQRKKKFQTPNKPTTTPTTWEKTVGRSKKLAKKLWGDDANDGPGPSRKMGKKDCGTGRRIWGEK